MRIYKDLIQHAISKLEDMYDWSGYTDDLHHVLFNEDYFIIGRLKAELWLVNNPGVFNAIREIQVFEDSVTGVNIDLGDPEQVVNMFAYIHGYDVLNLSETYVSALEEGDSLNLEQVQQIIKELYNAMSTRPHICV